MGKDRDSLQEQIAKYEKHFEADIAAIDEELTKSKEYSAIIDSQIEKLNEPSLGMNKGGQHYLIEHIRNAVQLQTQRQSLRKDKFSIKKSILDYALKFAEDKKSENGEGDILEAIESLKKTLNIQSPESAPVENLDEEIDRLLDDEN